MKLHEQEEGSAILPEMTAFAASLSALIKTSLNIDIKGLA